MEDSTRPRRKTCKISVMVRPLEPGLGQAARPPHARLNGHKARLGHIAHKCTGSEAHTCHPYLLLVPSKAQQDAGDKPAWNAQPRLDAQVCLRQTPQLTSGPISCTIISRVSETSFTSARWPQQPLPRQANTRREKHFLGDKQRRLSPVSMCESHATQNGMCGITFTRTYIGCLLSMHILVKEPVAKHVHA